MATVNQLCEWVESITKNGVNLTTKETEFIEDQMNRIEMYGDRVKFSDKQAEWIEAIYAKRTS